MKKNSYIRKEDKNLVTTQQNVFGNNHHVTLVMGGFCNIFIVL